MPLPVDYQTCTVTGSWVDIATSDPGSGYVVFTPRATRITTGSEVIVLPTARRVWLEGGAINIELPATDDPDVAPVDWTYQVVETIGGVEYPAYDIEAPAEGEVDLSSVAGAGSAGTIIAVQGEPGVEGPQPDLSGADPEPLGVAGPGVGDEASRSDHVHPMPSASDVGAAPTSRTITAGTGLTGGGTLAADRTIAADLSSANGAALGVAAPGVATTIARADHVHPMPSASDVGGIPATIIDAAGDLIVGTAADTAARLAVGTSGQVLTSNGTTATWATPSSTPAEVFIPATTLHGSTNVQSNWSTYPTRAHAFHQLNDSATSTVGVTLGKSIPWASVDVYAVVGNPTAGGGDVRWTLYYGKNAGQTNARSSVSTTTTLAVGQATYPEPQRVKVGNAIAWDATGEWSLVLSRLGSDGADTLTTPIFLQGIAIRPAGT